MANPPIVIGPFDNVPAPGSPIRSDWAQELTQRVVDMAPGWVLASRGADEGAGTGAWANVTFTAPQARKPGIWLVIGSAIIRGDGAVAPVSIRITDNVGAELTPAWVPVTAPNGGDAAVVAIAFKQTLSGAPVGFSLESRSDVANYVKRAGSSLAAVYLGPLP